MQIVQLQRGNKCFHLVLLSVKPLSSPLGPGVGRVTSIFSLDRQTALTLWAGAVTFRHLWGCQGAWAERGHQPKICSRLLLPLRELEKFTESRGQSHLL